MRIELSIDRLIVDRAMTPQEGRACLDALSAELTNLLGRPATWAPSAARAAVVPLAGARGAARARGAAGAGDGMTYGGDIARSVYAALTPSRRRP